MREKGLEVAMRRTQRKNLIDVRMEQDIPELWERERVKRVDLVKDLFKTKEEYLKLSKKA